MLVVVNLDAHQRQAGFVDVDLAPLGLPYESAYDVVDQLTDAQFGWQGAWNYVDLDPSSPAHIFRVEAQ